MSQWSVLANVFLVVSALFTEVVAADWARFRGPNGSGVSPDSQAVPVQWSDTENLKWKAELPGRDRPARSSSVTKCF